jgi:very-short-patch-repair endonuclease
MVRKYAKCVICGKEFELIHGKGTMVCSKECLGKLRSQMLSVEKTKCVCKNCGSEFEKRYSTEKQEFCCRKCYWEYRRNHKESDYADVFENKKKASREIRHCEMCGKEFEVYKKTKKRFCSDECRVKYQNTEEFKSKRINTMLSKYGKKSVGNGMTAEKLEEYEKIRKEKYLKLCEESNMELIDFVDRHILHVRCKKCGKDFITNNLSYIHYDKIHCKYCSDEYKDYKPSIKIYGLLNELNIEYIKNDRIQISPYELDIYIPSKKIAIEVNGNFWHSELVGKDKNYHINKTILCNDKGIKLIHIFEDEVVNKWDIVKSRIMSMLGFNKTIYARKCDIVDLTFQEKKIFLNENHIQGDSNSSINIGLKYNNEIVAAMTFSKERVIYNGKQDKGHYELIRYANKLGYNVVGGFSKLLSHFIKENSAESLKTFCDARWSGINPLNTVYSKCGFKYIGLTKPNYWYMHKTNMLNRKHRYNFTKHSILKNHTELDPNKTEWELMKELGYNRIWDCGNMKFILTPEGVSFDDI